MTKALLLDGDALAVRLRADLASRVTALRQRGHSPCLATLLIGDHSASDAYVARKHADCAEIGITSKDIRLPHDIDPQAALAEIAALNADPSVHGFLVQLPLPDHLDAQTLIEAVDPAKDIDGLHPVNLGRLVAAAPGLRPCTPQAILALLRAYNIPLAGRSVVIVGRGALVGRPLAMLLSLPGTDATVTLLHRQSANSAAAIAAADVVISAAGVPDLIRGAMIKPGAAVVGVGISYDAAGQMVSDIAADVGQIARWVTPRHGSVGALTRAFLLSNLVTAMEQP
ncbi:bifunctional 5,10-methylenetetrahydrofolate dehydrogenase/5,10-methenyltetrahydrofolate cyclohydrolase [Pseudoruegeria sp. SK021]|uniref:bifunctional 5,10-methylenetetrahydrofolate dehydrogenase/5,10-methenyltetrahydrofolate cyclohydrolase n=1 Tax=Pseudoruegeria sp. SK021 TaxID=1933035 RepID=UPI00197FFB97|nr:tetrahydrofolate dehydrogenase/cyclohydrolase catalytic domain-containing protein [Pseudoruegeria sp. SK021]